ncbi:MAG: ABC transporter ATP-binding protein [Verrucomicrobiales bacterium]|nr:ABC transporter ATP-binding protein [Verrucomicrobiales bacterium]
MIDVRQLRIRAGRFALSDVSFTVGSGAYAVLMGKTGSGKTTLLEGICGLRTVEAGSIRLAGRDITRLPPASRGIGFVPQEAALFQHLTVAEHLAFALRVRRWPEAAIRARVAEIADSLQIGPLLERRPQGLSGGEAQRVALGRALSFHPAILCLDEPLSALDDATRDEICTVLADIHSKSGVTVLHITHNRREADRLATVVLRLDQGTVTEESRNAPPAP